MLKSVIKRLLSPNHLWRAARASKKTAKVPRSTEDPQLKLYDAILQTDFLHYGYFNDPETPPDKISLYDIRQAQIRYAELIIEQLIHEKGKVLDVGCGMGGLIGMLLSKGHETVGITPDRHQVNYIQEKYPAAKLIKAKFQNMKTDDYENFFDSIIHSESLQYIKLDKAIENVLKMLKNHGRWIVVDYFRFTDAHEKSGHLWEEFEEKLINNNFKIVHKKDITPNIMPTLAYIYMWGNQIGKPVFEFLISKLARKHPGKHYILDEAIGKLNYKIEHNLNIVNPEIFCRDKKYILTSIERT